MRKRRGFTLAEAIVYLAIFSVMMTFVITMMVSGSQLFRSGSASVGIQQGMSRVLSRLSQDLQESDPHSIAIGYVNSAGSSTYYPAASNSYQGASAGVHCDMPPYCTSASPQITTAIIMLSARDSNNTFDYGSSKCTGNPGLPCWHKWVCYYLTPNPGASSSNSNTLYSIVRVENSASAGANAIPAGANYLPTTVAAPPPTPLSFANGWEATMRSLTSGKETLATNLNRFFMSNPETNNMFTNPFNFDAPTGGNSTLALGGLSSFWVSLESEGYNLNTSSGQIVSLSSMNTSQINKARITALFVIKN